MSNRRVVLAGWGQVTQGKAESLDRVQDPIGLMAAASRQAFEMFGALDVLGSLDGLMVVKVMSAYYTAADRYLAERMGIAPRFSMTSKIGGNSPQSLINKAAGMIARRQLDSVLITGAEAYYPRDKSRLFHGNRLFQGFSSDYEEDDIIGATELEARHGMSLPIHGFPLYETALWAESGMALGAHMEKIGELWAGFSKVAATHQNAWSRKSRTVEEISVPSPSNRFIGFPYTKLMNPLIAVDLSAAVVLMAEEKAKRYSRKGKRPVYFWGGGYAEDRQRFLINKSDFTSSLALKAASEKAIKRCCLSLEEVECFDIYSCFPCSVRIARKMLSLSENDPRPLTLTGGLCFFGGPGNNYSLHAVATLADSIAGGQVNNGMITALGWFMHKHAAGIYGGEPLDTDLSHQDIEDERDYRVGNPPLEVVDETSGNGIIETYTVIHSKDGTPSHAILYGKTENGFRFVAQNHPREDMIGWLLSENKVGNIVRVIHDRMQKRNLAAFK
jgi:acetyl-CoA C-acetyltransferase